MAAIVLRRPDDARARPSSLLKRDDTYVSVFNPDYPIDLFLKVVLFMRRVEEFLRVTVTDIPPSERNDLKYHLATFAAARYARRIDPSPVHLAATALEDIDDDYLKECLDLIIRAVEVLAVDVFEARDTDKIAKSPDLVALLIRRFAEVIQEDQESSESFDDDHGIDSSATDRTIDRD
jgi:hypothetical protein